MLSGKSNTKQPPADHNPGSLTAQSLSHITEHCPDILWSYNISRKSWCYISPSVERLTGYTAQEVSTCPAQQLISRASLDLFRSSARCRFSLDQAHEGAVYRDELELIRKDGSLVRCDVSSHCFRDNDGDLILSGVTRELKDQAAVEQALRISEAKYREILHSIEEGYYETDLLGRITFFNEACCRMLGYGREEFSSIDYRILYHDPETVQQKFNQVYLTRKPENGFATEMLRKNGEIIHLEISISPMVDHTGEIAGFRGIARDITERVNFLHQLEYFSMHDQLTGLYNRTYFEEELRRLSKGREYPVTLISADVNGLKLINDTMGHDQGDRLLQAAAQVMQESLRGSDVLARVGGDEFTALLPSADEKTGRQVINRIRSKIKQYCKQNPDLYLSLSLGQATAADSSTSFKELFKQADDAMYRDKFAPSTAAKGKILKNLMDVLAEKDYILEGHARRLALLCRKVGNKMGLSVRRQADLALLAQVHDLGKVGIPDQIIFKDGPLNDQEWAIMKQHPEKGYRIALSSTYLCNIAALILKHHERWDGSGYPLGLKKEEIPIECRVFAVVDSYDTMISTRPYSSAKSKREALDELNACAGSQFDPAVVEAFTAVFS